MAPRVRFSAAEYSIFYTHERRIFASPLLRSWEFGASGGRLAGMGGGRDAARTPGLDFPERPAPRCARVGGPDGSRTKVGGPRRGARSPSGLRAEPADARPRRSRNPGAAPGLCSRSRQRRGTGGDARPEGVESRRGADNCFRRRALPGGAPGSGTVSPRIAPDPPLRQVVRYPRRRRAAPRPSRNRGTIRRCDPAPAQPPAGARRRRRRRRPGLRRRSDPELPGRVAERRNCPAHLLWTMPRRQLHPEARLPRRGATGNGARSPRIPRSGRSSAIPDAGPAFPGLPGTGARSAGEIRRRPGPAPGGAQIPNFRAESRNAATARSTCSGPCAADNCTRMRAFPSGTTG